MGAFRAEDNFGALGSFADGDKGEMGEVRWWAGEMLWVLREEDEVIKPSKVYASRPEYHREDPRFWDTIFIYSYYVSG